MNIDEPLRSLGPVDMEALRDCVLGQEAAAWTEQQLRQEEYEVHRLTESIVMVFCDGWPELTVTKDKGWDRLEEVAVPVMHDIIGRFYPAGGTIIRAMAAKLLAGSNITPHYDAHPSFSHAHRIHVPISTNHRVRFMIDGRPYQLKVGEAYEINNQKTHSVMNRGKEDRVTFIFDYVPPDRVDRDRVQHEPVQSDEGR
jgi:hypothetical protein